MNKEISTDPYSELIKLIGKTNDPSTRERITNILANALIANSYMSDVNLHPFKDQDYVKSLCQEPFLSEGGIDRGKGVVREYAYEFETYFDKNNKEQLRIDRMGDQSIAVSITNNRYGHREEKYYVDGNRRRKKQYQNAFSKKKR